MEEDLKKCFRVIKNEKTDNKMKSRAYSYIGLYYRDLETDSDKCIEYFLRAIELDPEDKNPYIGLNRYYRKRRLWNKVLLQEGLKFAMCPELLEEYAMYIYEVENNFEMSILAHEIALGFLNKALRSKISEVVGDLKIQIVGWP